MILFLAMFLEYCERCVISMKNYWKNTAF